MGSMTGRTHRETILRLVDRLNMPAGVAGKIAAIARLDRAFPLQSNPYRR
jgi:hypothetical protein